MCLDFHESAALASNSDNVSVLYITRCVKIFV